MTANDLDDRTYALLFGIRRSVRYHQNRRRFYELWNTVTVVVGVIGGSSAATAVVAELPHGWGWLPALLGAIVALVSATDLAVGTAKCADHHSDLARQFIGLEQRFTHGRNLDDDEHDELIKNRLRIESGEPVPLRLLDAMCHFELLRSMGDTRRPVIPWWRRKLAHWFSQADYVVQSGIS